VHTAHPAPRDEDLIRQTLAGSREAFGLLVRRHAPTVRAACIARTGLHQELDDMVQETFLRAYEGLPRVLDTGRFGAYVHGIALHLCADRLRRKARGVASLESVELEPAARAEDCEDERLAKLRAAVGRLPEAQREALLLFYFQDLSYERMAAVLGITAAAVNQRLTRARAQLRERLGVTAGGRS
jgi:RNA polymerase sigma-70 factor (ECF subfamily)